MRFFMGAGDSGQEGRPREAGCGIEYDPDAVRKRWRKSGAAKILAAGRLLQPAWSIAMRRLACTFFLLVASRGIAAEPPFPAAERAAMLGAFGDEIAAIDVALTTAPREVALYSRRGDRHLFLAHFAAAVSDFERMIALDRSLDTGHWRLGIAYYFAGDFARAARQFEKYHAADSRDRENGIWKFLADVKVLGLEPARRAMLTYTRFDREPFPALYQLFAGAQTTSEFMAALAARGLTGDARVMFFAHYYAGLNEALLGRTESARGLLRSAVANSWGRTAEGGPAYMWQVARLHYEALAAAPL
jgi:lipoprotein NlpI